MNINSNKLMTPAAAFTMAIVVIFYTRSTIQQVRREADVQSRDKSFGMYKQTQTKSVVKVKLFYTTTLKYYSSTL